MKTYAKKWVIPPIGRVRIFPGNPFYSDARGFLILRDQARKWFEQCVRTGVEFDPDTLLGTPMNEYELAQWRLESLFSRAP